MATGPTEGSSPTGSQSTPSSPAVRRLALAMLKDAVEVYYGRAAIKGKYFERDRTWTVAWFFSPERYHRDDPLSFESVCRILGLEATAVRHRLVSEKAISLKGVTE